MSESRKEEIVWATLELAADKGLGSVSMQQIADKVGITKASLYNHFSSRDEIVEAMYDLIRKKSKEKASIIDVDYDTLTSKGSMKDVLNTAVNSYKSIVNDPQMYLFYKIIISERPISRVASEIMVRETRTMIEATKALFRSLQERGKADFQNVDTAALSFAMAIHSIMDHEIDLDHSGIGSNSDLMGDYIDEFCRIYSSRK